MVNKWIEKIIPENFYDTKVGVQFSTCGGFVFLSVFLLLLVFPFDIIASHVVLVRPTHTLFRIFSQILTDPSARLFSYSQFTCSPIAPNSVLYPWTIFVNAVWLFSFAGFFWWYTDPSMYITQSVIQKEHFKAGFTCSPLDYDDHYDVALGYEECLVTVREPNVNSVKEAEGKYSFVPFNPVFVKKSDGNGVDVSLYNPVGGGTSVNALAEQFAAAQEEYENFFSDYQYDPVADSLFGPSGGFDLETGESIPDFGSGDFSGDDSSPGGSPSGLESSPEGESSGLESSPEGEPSGLESSPEGESRKRTLLQDTDIDIEYTGLAELSGCNCDMIVSSEDDNEKKQLKFYSRNSPDMTCNAEDTSRRKLLQTSDCTMNTAKAILMYKQFMINTDPCEFVKRNAPFQCIREEAAPLSQRLSLAYANSGLLYSVIAALAVNYMYATKKVTLESVDIEQLQKMASMNQVSAEEPAK